MQCFQISDLEKTSFCGVVFRVGRFWGISNLNAFADTTNLFYTNKNVDNLL